MPKLEYVKKEEPGFESRKIVRNIFRRKKTSDVGPDDADLDESREKLTPTVVQVRPEKKCVGSVRSVTSARRASKIRQSCVTAMRARTCVTQVTRVTPQV